MNSIRSLCALGVALLFSANLAIAKAPSPTEAYLKIHQQELIMTKYDDMLKWRSSRSIAKDPKISAAECDKMIGLMKMMMPQKVIITSEKITGDEATLTVTAPPNATDDPTSKTTGTITMVLEKGQWKLDREKWATRFGNDLPPPTATTTPMPPQSTECTAPPTDTGTPPAPDTATPATRE